jgi:hypothetical protein
MFARCCSGGWRPALASPVIGCCSAPSRSPPAGRGSKRSPEQRHRELCGDCPQPRLGRSSLQPLRIEQRGRQQGRSPSLCCGVRSLGLQLVVTTVLWRAPARRSKDRANPADHRRRRVAGAGPQSLRAGLAGEPVEHPLSRCSRWRSAGPTISTSTRSVTSYPRPSRESGLARDRCGADGAAVRARARHEDDWRIRLSRAATFQSLSLLAICAYFAVMAVLATAICGNGGATGFGRCRSRCSR